MKRYLAALAVILMVLAGAAYAQVDTSPGVARISLIHGDVTMQRSDSGDWVAATLNTPVVRGDGVSTGNNSRTELQLDYANILRMDANSYAKVVQLNRANIQVQLGAGRADYSVFKGSEADAEIDTPNVAVRPVGPGVYRIEVNSNAETQVIVRKGEAEITTPQGSTRVQSGQLITIQGTDNPEYQTVSAPEKDDWDRWNSDRDSLIQRAESWRHTNRYYTGADDLDAYGHWVYVPDYGQVWSPAVGPDWAPYRAGRWVWEPYYGWTWVSYEPWGWAPYHYGRWFLYGSSWCWWPGPVFVQPAYYPVWAPAYVSFFGFGFRSGGFSFGFGYGSLGWLPVGPGDYFYPWYGRRGGNIINVTNVTNVTNIYNNRTVNKGGIGPLYRGRNPYSNVRGALNNNVRILNAVSTVPADRFGKGAVPTRAARIDPATFRQGGLMMGRVPANANRESMRPSDRQAPVTVGNRLANNQRFFNSGRAAAESRPGQQTTRSMNTLPARTQVNSQPGRRAGGGPQNSQQAQLAQRSGWQPFGRAAQTNDAAITQRNAAARQNTPAQRNAGISRADRSGTPRQSQQRSRDGWQSFSRGGSNQGGANVDRNQNWRQSPSQQRGNGQREAMPSRGPRNEQPPAGNQGGWQRFSQRSEQPQLRPDNGGRSYGQDAGQGNRMERQPGWQQFPSRSDSPQYESPRSMNSDRGWQRPSDGVGRSDRPPLDLRQPIVTRRPSSGYEGGYGGRNVYRGNSGGGNYGGRDVYRGNSGGGGYGGRGSAPARQNGGGGGGGGGGRGSSAPRSSGPGRR